MGLWYQGSHLREINVVAPRVEEAVGMSSIVSPASETQHMPNLHLRGFLRYHILRSVL